MSCGNDQTSPRSGQHSGGRKLLLFGVLTLSFMAAVVAPLHAQNTVYEAVFDRHEYFLSYDPSVGSCGRQKPPKITTTSPAISVNEALPCTSGANLSGSFTLPMPAKFTGVIESSPNTVTVFRPSSPIDVAISGTVTLNAGGQDVNTFTLSAGVCETVTTRGFGMLKNTSKSLEVRSSCLKSFLEITRTPFPGVRDGEVVIGSSADVFVGVNQPIQDQRTSYSILTYYRLIDRAPSPTPTPTPPPPSVTGLDQKLAARGSTIRINIHGNNFNDSSAPAFDDPRLLITEVKAVSSTELQALLSVSLFAELGAKTLSVSSGAEVATFPKALFVTEFYEDTSQGSRNAVFADLVANHPTVVGIGIIESALQQPGHPAEISGLLYVFNGETQIAGSPFLPNKPLRPDLNSDKLHAASFTNNDQFFLRQTLNYYFGLGASLPSYDALPEGSYNFVLAVSPTDPANPPPRLPQLSKSELKANHDFIVDETGQRPFVTTKPYRLYVMVDPRLSTERANALYNFHERDFEYLAAAFPVDGSHSKLDIRRAGYSTLDIDDLKPKPEEKRLWADKVIERMREILSNLNGERPNEQNFNATVLILESAAFAKLVTNPDLQGLARVNGGACIIAGANEQALAHELGHTLGLLDTYKVFPPLRSSPNPRQFDAPDGGNLVETGARRLAQLHRIFTYPAVAAVVNSDGEALPEIPYRMLSLMGGASLNWTDQTESKYLYNRLSLPAVSAAKGSRERVVAASAPADGVTVHGFIDVTDQVTVTSVRHAVLPPAVVQPGDLTLELLNGSGQALSATSFAVDFAVPEAGLVSDTSFSASTAYVGGATAVRIRKGNNVLYSQPISPNAPNVQILSPSGGEALGGPFTISWNASDPDGDSLTYSVIYLRDDGTPTLIADRLATTSFQWSNPSNSGGSNNGRIIVTANDGVNEGRATSSPFSVNKSGPIVTILSPQSGAAIPAGTQVTLSGAGSDPEDGYLPASSLSFRSSIDGDLGSGAVVRPTLSAGSHTITLRGLDSDGIATETSITLTVGGATSVPMVDSISPARGAAGSPITLKGRNFSAGATVKFGLSAATVVSVSASQIVVMVPSGQPVGETEIVVTSGGFTTTSTPFKVTYGRPLLTSLSPESGPPGTPVNLRGAEFATSSSGNTVRFGNTTAAVLGAGLNGLLVAVPPSLNPSGTNVTVTTSQGTSDPLPFMVTTGDPATPVVLRSLTPASGPPNTLVTITGQGFSSVRASNVVNFSDVTTTPITAATDSLQVVVPYGMPAGSSNVVVTVNAYPSNPLPFNVSAPTPTPGPGLPGCVAVPNNLISWWRAEGDASDVTGANPGTLQGGATASATGKVGQAFTFNGSSGYVSIGNPASLKLTGAMTIEGWINPAGAPGTNLLAAILTKWAQDAGSSTTSDSYGLWIINRGGTLKLFSALHKATGAEPNIEGGVIPLNAWSHVAMTFDPTSGQYAIYLNGAQVTTVSSPGNNLATERNVSIGREESFLPRYFKGLIDELSVYGRALSSAEIQSIYNAASAGKCAGPSAPPPVSQLQNISTRLQVGTGDSLAIGGFIVVGTGAKPVIVRAIGPSLAKAGVAGALADPTLDLVNGSGDSLIFNDDWVSSSQAQQIRSILPPSSNSESTAIAALTPGAYTVLLRGYNDTTGVGLVELYDLDQGTPARLANISTRGYVGADASVLIGGFIVGQRGQFVVRAIGPSLGAAGVPNLLGDPVLDLYNAQGQRFATNDNWRSDQEAALIATGIPPNDDRESAIVQTLAPGAYTAIVRGVGGTTGVGLVEVYNLQ